MLVLRDIREHFGLRATQNDDVLLARSFVNMLSAQQLSPSTYIYEIKFVPAGFGVRINADSEFFIENVGLDLHRRLEQFVLTDATVRNAASFVVGLSSAVAGIGDCPVKLDLSGGRASRAILGGALTAGVIGQIAVRTRDDSPPHRRDAAVARILAQELGFPLEVPSAEASATTTMLWAAGSAFGLHDRLLPDPLAPDDAGSIVVSGRSADVFAPAIAVQSIDALVDELDEGDARDALIRELESGLRGIGIDASTRRALHLHDLAYRSGMRGAPSTWSHLTSIRPLQQLGLAAAAHAAVADESGESMMKDVLVLTSIDAAELPFDLESKSISRQETHRRLGLLGGPLTPDEIKPVSIYGVPALVPAGATELSLSIARAYDLAIVTDASSLLERADTARGEIQSESAADRYGDVYENARWRLLEKKMSATQAAPALAKTLSLAVFGKPALEVTK